MSITNRKASAYVARCENFKTGQGSIFGESVDTKNGRVYVVYSYGRHFPLFVNVAGQWYANSDRYSVTTSKHYGQVNPDASAIKLNTEQLKQLVYTGQVVA